MRFLIVNILAAGLILSAAFVHGRWTHRWNPFDRDAVTANLARVPLTFGDWQGVDAEDADISTWRDEMDLGLIRRYSNPKNGETVLMMLRGGPPGPIGKHHTPASCYHAVGFLDRGADVTRRVGEPTEAENTFWVSAFEKPGDSLQRVRVYWAYSGGRGWIAPTNPRIQLAEYETCYKIYIIRNLPDPKDGFDGDACENFLRIALPAIESAIFPANAGPAAPREARP